MAIIILQHTWGLQGVGTVAGAIQTKFQAALTAAGVVIKTGGTYQADIDVDQVYIDPALNLTKAQIKAKPITMKHFGDGFTTFDAAGIHAVSFIIDDADFAKVVAILPTLKGLA